MMNMTYNAIVIGSGISGLYTALKLNQNSNSGVLLVTKSTLGESNSYYAQGGMVAVLKDNKKDSIESHIRDTLNAGAGLNETETVKFISESSDKVVHDLLNFGVDFDRDENGNFKLTKEAAHSVNRILHSGGDATGREIEKALVKSVKNSGIKVIENTAVTELIVENGTCIGVKINDNRIYANTIIVATGGIGQIYKYTTNPIGATGDGIALCYRAGAVLRDMEFVQFHPTALAIDDMKNRNRFLISEAVRGEGAKLCDKNGYCYMKDYDERGELAPRDIVARANFTQMQKTNSDCVYLDARAIKEVSKRFPTISTKCKEYGIDIERDLIPVAPAAHYFMGGIKTDYKGQTSIKNLYAIGECASTGLHGANRLASNSLLECVVCAYEAAQNLKKETKLQKCEETKSCVKTNLSINNPVNLSALKNRQKLKDIMWQNVGIYRDEKSLQKALNGIEKIDDCDDVELKNMLLVSKLITQSALNRKESRGAHYRTDYPQTGSEPCHSEIKKGEIYAE